MKFRLEEKTVSFSSAYSDGAEYSDVGGIGGDCYSLVCVADVDTPSAKTFDSGKSQIAQLTFAAKAGTTAGDYVVMYDSAGLGWAVYADTTGSTPAPSGAIYAAIPSGRKTKADISGATTAASVAAIFETSFNSLTSFPFTTDDSAADGTMLVTTVIRGPCTTPVVKNANDSGAGSIQESVSVAGVVSEVDISANSLSIPSHGLSTGLKGQLTSTGTLPTGYSTSTDYFVIVVDANTIKLASSLALAQAGTAVDISSQGTDGAVNTFTPTALAGGSIKLQGANFYNGASTVWIDIGSASNITVDANFGLVKDRPEYRYVRPYISLTAGHISATLYVLVKGDKD